MISYQEAFNHIVKQPAPSAQLKPVAKQQPKAQPSVFQNAVSTAGNFVKGLAKDPGRAVSYAINPTQTLASETIKKKAPEVYKSVVKPGSTVDTLVRRKFSEIPKTVVQDFKGANQNMKTQIDLTKKVATGGKLTPEENEVFKQGNLSMLGTVDAGIGGKISKSVKDSVEAASDGFFPSAAKKVEEKVVETVSKPTASHGDDWAGRIIKDIKSAVPVRKEQQQLYSAELKERTAKVVQAGETLKGREAHYAQKSALKGELAPDPDFTPIRGNYKPEDVDKMFDTIEANPNLRPLEKVDAKDALDKLLDGKVPQKAEIAKLETVFGKQFGETITKKSMGKLEKVANTVGEYSNIPRALNSSVDLSASGRQGVFAIPSHPVAAAKSFVKQFQAAFSEGGYEKVMQDIQKRPAFKVARDVGVAFTDTSGALSGKEEAYMTNLAEKIPILGKLVRASDRAYSGFLNNFRSELFEGFYKNAEKLGRGNDLKLLKNYAGLVNNMTGRGDLGMLNRYAPLLNGAFFSPRLMASRVQLMNPIYYARLDPVVRKEAMKSLVAFVGTGLSILGMAKAAGLEVGTDPRSSDFGKIKVGNTRYDIWGGFSQYAVFLSRFYMNESMSTTSGKLTKFGEGYKPTNRQQITGRFAESKLAPVASISNDLAKGTDQMGKPLKFLPEDASMDEIQDSQVFKRLSPFFVQDFLKLVQEYGLPTGALMSIPGFFGTGGNTYGGEPTKSKSKVKIGPTVLR